MEDTVQYCCSDMGRLMKNRLFVERLSVTPSVLIFKKHEKCRTYKKTIEIKNEDVSAVCVKLSSNFSNELGFRTNGDEQIESQLVKSVEVYYEPTEASLRTETENRRLSILISMQHPKLTIEVPVLVYRKALELLIPKRIFFPKCCVDIVSYYCMVVYNPSKKIQLFLPKWTNNISNVKLLTDRKTFPGNSCAKILFSIKPKNHCHVYDELTIMCYEKFTINFTNEVVDYEPHISNIDVHFPRVYFNFSADEYLRVCNESFETIKIKWCRRKIKDGECSNGDEYSDGRNIKQIDKNFMIAPKSASIPPNSSLQIRAIFIPKPNLSGIESNDLVFKAKAYLAFSTNENTRLRMSLMGSAKGPCIILNFCFLEFDRIVIGEKRCIRVKARNSSKIPGTIKFIGSDGKFGGKATCEPLFHTLDPDEEKQFIVEYCTTLLGKFMEKIFFQIENGRTLHMMISGISEPIRLIPIPDSIDYGNVYICSLQKRELVIRNPLSSAVIVTLFADNDGVQEPLIISNFQEFVDGLVTTDQDDKSSILSSGEPRFMACNPPNNVHCGFDAGTTSSLPSSKSISQSSFAANAEDHNISTSEGQESSKSSGFIKFIENTDKIAKDFLKVNRVQEMTSGSHPDLDILQNIVSDLLKTDYFQPLAEIIESQKDQMKLPTAPREYLFSPEGIIIDAFSSESVPVFVAPNRSGKTSVHLKLQVTIIDNRSKDVATVFAKDCETISIPKEATITTVELSHRCVVPELDVFTSMNVDTGIDLPTKIEFPIKNLVNVPGIITINFKNISSMDLSYTPKRFAIKAFESVKCDLVFTSRAVGDSVLTGWIDVFGSQKQYLFQFNCHTMPPKVKIHMTPIKYTGKVLVHDSCKTYIENLGNGLLQYSVKLKKGIFLYSSTNCGFIYPTECKEICLLTKFEDPGSYKDVLHIIVKHLDTIDVPVQATIYGLPLKFKPSLDPVINLNIVGSSAKLLKTPVCIKNLGRNTYKVYIVRKKQKQDIEEKSRFDFSTSSVTLNSQETGAVELLLNRKDAMKLTQEFYVDAIEMVSRKRIAGFVFSAQVNIIVSKLIWSRPKLEFEFRNSDFYEISLGESVNLNNKTELVEHVKLESTRNFEIFDPIKHAFYSRFCFTMEPGTTREFIICFDVKEINQWNQDVNYEGKIFLTTPDRRHKSLSLFCKIFFPIVNVPRQMVHFYSQTPFAASFNIDNPGEMLAFYNWIEEGPPLKENIHLVKQCNFRNLWEYLRSQEPARLFVVDITKEWLTSFKKFMEYNLEEDAVVEEISDTEEIVKLDTYTDTPKEELSAKSSKKGGKKPKKQDSEDPKSKQKKGKKPDKSTPKSSKKGKKSKTVEEPPIIVEEEPKPPEFVCKESKLQVGFNEIFEKLHQVFHIERKKDPKITSPVSGDICKIAKEYKIEILHDKKSQPYFTLDPDRGSLQPKAEKKIHLYFSGDSENVYIEATFRMDVVGGKSEKFQIKLCNAPAEVEISKSYFNIGMQPWYKINYFQINVRNTNPIPVQIGPLLNQYESKDKRLLRGFIDVLPKEYFILAPDASVRFFIAAFVGLNQTFHDAFGIEVNSLMPATIDFKGRALIPMLSVLNVERLPFDNVTIEEEYKLLNRIFKSQISCISTNSADVTDNEIEELKEAIGTFEAEEMAMEQDIVVVGEESVSSKTASGQSDPFSAQLTVPQLCPEISPKVGDTTGSLNAIPEDQTVCSLSCRKDPYNSFDILNTNKLGITPTNQIELVPELKRPTYRAAVMEIVDPDLADFCILDYPNEYPSSLKINHLMEIEHFQSKVANNVSAWRNYVRIVKKFVLKNMNVEKYSFKEKKFEQPIRPMSFKIQPLPFYTSSYRLDLGKLILGEKKNWTLDLYYHGPGKVYISVRTLIVIPGMKITFLKPKFECDGVNGEYRFSIYNTSLVPKENYKYGNIKSRSSEDIRSIQHDCGECKGDRLCHAHSFDFNKELIHTRDLNKINRKAINEFYSWWNRPDKELKDPYINCEIFQERLADTEDKVFKLNIQFTPTSKCYDDPTMFEDYIYIDMHLGPTIPILLEGNITSIENDLRGSSETTSIID